MRRKVHSREAYLKAIGPDPLIFTPTGIKAVVYYTEEKGQPCVLAFAGKSQKPGIYLRFRSIESRDSRVNEWLEGLRANAERKARRQAERKAFRHSFNVDDILHYSWGYDQTNPEFYQVIAVDEFRVTLRQIAMESVGGGGGSSMSDNVMPLPGSFIGEAITKRPGPYDNGPGIVSMKYGCATLWSGKPMYRSWYA